MQYFIGVVPPDDYRQKLMQFQNRWPNNRINEFVEPHITVKAQDGLGPDLEWLEKVKRICTCFPAFQVSITESSTFRDDVVYLGIKSVEIQVLHEQLVRAVSPAPQLVQKYFELDLYRPHMTLGRKYLGLTEWEISQMLDSARTELNSFLPFTVTHVRIYREIAPDKYVPFEDVNLA